MSNPYWACPSSWGEFDQQLRPKQTGDDRGGLLLNLLGDPARWTKVGKAQATKAATLTELLHGDPATGTSLTT